MEHMSAKALVLVFRVSFTSESWWKSSGPERACLRASWSQEWSWQSNTLSSQLRNRSKWKDTLISEIERFFIDSAFAFSENNIGSSNKEKTNSLMKNGKVDALCAFKDLFYEPKRSSKKERRKYPFVSHNIGSDTFCVRTSKWVFAEIVGQEPAVSPAPMAHDCQFKLN